MELCYINNGQSLFRKYSRLVTSITQHKLGRDFLGIKDNDISLLLPNGYHRSDGTYHQATFYTRPVYSPKLSFALSRLDIIANYVNGFDEALATFFYQLGLIRNPGYAPDVLMQDFVPDADPETTSVDGNCNHEQASASWATTHDSDGSTNTSAYPSGTTSHIFYLAVPNGEPSDTWTYMARSFLLFDTSSLGADAMLQPGANTLNLYGTINSNQFSLTGYLVTAVPASNTNLVATDYNKANFGTTNLLTAVVSSFNTSQYNAYTLNSTGESTVSLTGITKIGFRNSADVADSPPAWAANQTSDFSYNAADNGSNKPTLTITYSSPSLSPSSSFSPSPSASQSPSASSSPSASLSPSASASRSTSASASRSASASLSPSASSSRSASRSSSASASRSLSPSASLSYSASESASTSASISPSSSESSSTSSSPSASASVSPSPAQYVNKYSDTTESYSDKYTVLGTRNE